MEPNVPSSRFAIEPALERTIKWLSGAYGGGIAVVDPSLKGMLLLGAMTQSDGSFSHSGAYRSTCLTHLQPLLRNLISRSSSVREGWLPQARSSECCHSTRLENGCEPAPISCYALLRGGFVALATLNAPYPGLYVRVLFERNLAPLLELAQTNEVASVGYISQ